MSDTITHSQKIVEAPKQLQFVGYLKGDIVHVDVKQNIFFVQHGDTLKPLLDETGVPLKADQHMDLREATVADEFDVADCKHVNFVDRLQGQSYITDPEQVQVSAEGFEIANTAMKKAGGQLVFDVDSTGDSIDFKYTETTIPVDANTFSSYTTVDEFNSAYGTALTSGQFSVLKDQFAAHDDESGSFQFTVLSVEESATQPDMSSVSGDNFGDSSNTVFDDADPSSGFSVEFWEHFCLEQGADLADMLKFGGVWTLIVCLTLGVVVGLCFLSSFLTRRQTPVERHHTVIQEVGVIVIPGHPAAPANPPSRGGFLEPTTADEQPEVPVETVVEEPEPSRWYLWLFVLFAGMLAIAAYRKYKKNQAIKKKQQMQKRRMNTPKTQV